MTIKFEILLKQIKPESHWGFLNYSNISDKDISVLMLCILHHNGKINRESFTKRLSQYFQGNMLERRLKTYKSSILNTWFSDVSLTAVLVEEVEKSCTAVDLTVDDYLKLLNLGFSKRKNYLVDWLAFNVFKPILYHNDAEWVYEFYSSAGIKNLELSALSFEVAERTYDLEFGYCCEDCSGCLSRYKRSQFEHLYRKDAEKELKSQIAKELLKYKKHLKNIYDEFKYDWS
jgi:hypothetical protein